MLKYIQHLFYFAKKQHHDNLHETDNTSSFSNHNFKENKGIRSIESYIIITSTLLSYSSMENVQLNRMGSPELIYQVAIH